MCGLAGFVGVSKNPQITHQIATRLFEKLEERGKDAAGFWGSEPGDAGSVIFHKEPGPSSNLVQQDIWRRVAAGMRLDLMLLHSRSASQGALPSKNKNNHPFTSTDKSIALVHNGKLPEHHDLRKKYEVRSDTDSEVLLRIFEWASINTTEAETRSELPSMDWITASKVMGLKKIFSYINRGWMAAAVAERGRENGERALWLFRNEHRPIYVIDIRDKLGQVFFCSTHEIWRKAIAEAPQARQFIGRRWCIEMPPDEIWHFAINDETPTPTENTVRKIDVTKGNVWRPLEDIASPLPVITSPPPFSVISYLNEHDEPTEEEIPRVAHKKRNKPARSIWYPVRTSRDEPFGTIERLTVSTSSSSHEDDEIINVDAEVDIAPFDEFQTGFDLGSLAKICGGIVQLGRDIQTTIENKAMEGSLLPKSFQELLEQLETHRLDLEGTMAIVEGN